MSTDDATLAFRQLGPNDIMAALDTAGFDCDGRMLALNSYENRVYQVGTEDGRWIVAKFYRPARWSDEAIQEEHDFALDLAEADIPVTAPFERDGETLLSHDLFRFTVYPHSPGRAPELDNLDLLEQLGRLVARIHRIGVLAPFEHRPRISLTSFGRESAAWLLENGFIPDDIVEAYSSLTEDLFVAVEAAWQRAGTPRELCLHGDFHPSNVLVNGEQLHIVDLDDARMGPAVQDLWMFLSGQPEEQSPQLDKLLKGYTQFRDFDPLELNLIEALRTLRIIHYAAWLARRAADPAFQKAFPWFNSRRYWDEHILALREQAAAMQEPPLNWSQL